MRVRSTHRTPIEVGNSDSAQSTSNSSLSEFPTPATDASTATHTFLKSETDPTAEPAPTSSSSFGRQAERGSSLSQAYAAIANSELGSEESINSSYPSDYLRGRNTTNTAVSSKEIGRTNAENRYSASPPGVDFPKDPATYSRSNSPTTQPVYDPSSDGVDNNKSAMIPPYGGIGSVRRERENRNPRPPYLKERRSAWVPETVAAPSDGVITPDWFDQR
jgi:hypothetical protein